MKDRLYGCKCGCNTGTVTPIMAAVYEYIHDGLANDGIDTAINSAYRCKDHNKAVGGSPTSSHLTGKAIDIAAAGSREKYLIVEAALEAGATRIGIGKGFIHIDVDDDKDQEVLWLY